MAKTIFVNGTFVQPAFLNSIFQAGGGHVHDGSDDDGHAPLVDLTAHVTGILQRANFEHAHTHDGTSESRIDLATQVSGLLSWLNLYSVVQIFDIEFDGFSGVNLSVPCIGLKTAQMYDSTLANQYQLTTVFLLGGSGTSDGTFLSNTPNGTLIPEAFRPSVGGVDVCMAAVVRDNNYLWPASAVVQDTGVIQFYKHPNDPDHFGSAGYGFSATGTKGFLGCHYSFISHL